MSLLGKRVLVVEDEMLVAMNIEDMLLELGAVVVGPAMRIEAALRLARETEFDVAMLDVNLHGGRSYSVAELLRARGKPFIFATGYGHTEDEAIYRDVLTLPKPFRAAELSKALVDALAVP